MADRGGGQRRGTAQGTGRHRDFRFGQGNDPDMLGDEGHYWATPYNRSPASPSPGTM